MTKYILGATIVMSVLCSCGEDKPKEARQSWKLPGEELMKKADCYTCHQLTEKSIGPAYTEIANKYQHSDSVYLAQKIIKGGGGVWGEVVMAPHPDVTEEQAKLMVEYILSLKNK